MSRMAHWGNLYAKRLSQFNRNIQLLLLSFLFIALGNAAWALMFNLFLQEKGYSKEIIGNILGMNNLGVALMALPAGIIIYRYLNHYIIVGSQILSVAFYFISLLFSDHPLAMQTCVFFASAFSVFLRIMAAPLIMANSRIKERTYIFSFVVIVNLVGTIVGNLLFGFLKDFLTLTLPSQTAYIWA
ncbi:MAG: MFS transporter, partial [Pseudomonadota bacterium]